LEPLLTNPPSELRPDINEKAGLLIIIGVIKTSEREKPLAILQQKVAAKNIWS